MQEGEVGIQWAPWDGEECGWLCLEEIGVALPQMAPFDFIFYVIPTLWYQRDSKCVQCPSLYCHIPGSPCKYHYEVGRKPLEGWEKKRRYL